jgi:hypothetical protein
MNDTEDEMTPEEAAALFGVPVPEEKEDLFPEEEIYSISARVKNYARSSANANLTPVGESLCNTYTHNIKALYMFSHSLNETDRTNLVALIKEQEKTPAIFIASIPTPVKPKKTITPSLDPNGPRYSGWEPTDNAVAEAWNQAKKDQEARQKADSTIQEMTDESLKEAIKQAKAILKQRQLSVKPTNFLRRILNALFS